MGASHNKNDTNSGIRQKRGHRQTRIGLAAMLGMPSTISIDPIPGKLKLEVLKLSRTHHQIPHRDA
jgi:hypothetical protein